MAMLMHASGKRLEHKIEIESPELVGWVDFEVYDWEYNRRTERLVSPNVVIKSDVFPENQLLVAREISKKMKYENACYIF